jgi:predicted MFS family arabinose efflux permease
VVFDLGAQAALIAHQAIIYSIDPEARSRLNAVLFVGMFTGMSSGAYLGSLVLARFGWQGVCVLAALSGLGALGVRLWPTNRKENRVAALVE